MRVKELASQLNVSAETIRFYTRIGMLSPAKNPANSYNEYGGKELARMRFILSARSLGFTVRDIEQVLSIADKDAEPCSMVKRLIEERLAETEIQFNDIKRLRNRMRAAVAQWRCQPGEKPDKNMICHLIESFEDTDTEV